MSARRVPLGLMAPVALLALVGALAYLQYQWVGQVSEAERAQLRDSLDRRAREFADDFDHEIGRVYQTFGLAPGFDPAHPDRFVRQWDEWKSVASFPGLIKTAYFATAADNGMTLARYSPDTRVFVPVEWPATLAPVRDHLMAVGRKILPGESPTVLAFNVAPVLPDIPAIVIPESPSLPASITHASSGASSVEVRIRTTNRHVILELDRDYIVNEVLPALVERHFPESGRDQYRVVVIDGASMPLLSRGLSNAERLTPAGADARASFFGIRIDLIRPLTAAAGAAKPVEDASTRADTMSGVVLQPAGEARAERFSVVVEQRGDAGSAMWTGSTQAGWTILLQHSAGSLDAAVALVRRHNLMLSFGILSVLLAGVGLIVINARRSERLATQQMDFVSTVSHELRTPLAVIRSAAQNLAAGVVHDAGQARRYGDLIEGEGRRLTDMVEQVLEYAGLGGNRRALDIRPVDAGAVVNDVASTCAGLPEAAGVEMAVDLAPDLPPLKVEEQGLRRALQNLVGNALKYAADGRWIGLTVARGTGREADEILITVADRGRGIPADELPHVLEPFYRGQYARDRQIHGNGLGLSLVKRIAEAHGGRVTVKSSAGQGTAVTLHLPVLSGPAGVAVASPVAGGRPA